LFNFDKGIFVDIGNNRTVPTNNTSTDYATDIYVISKSNSEIADLLRKDNLSDTEKCSIAKELLNRIEGVETSATYADDFSTSDIKEMLEDLKSGKNLSKDQMEKLASYLESHSDTEDEDEDNSIYNI
jgi:hypothetical protein